MLILCLSNLSLLSQDTIPVFFNSGSARLTNIALSRLFLLQNEYQYTTIDSIHFIGIADTTGSISSNLKLSHKRAKNVASQLQEIYPEVPIEIMAIGEKPAQLLFRSRCVLIIIYTTPEPVENSLDLSVRDILSSSDSTIKVVPKCYLIDYQLLRTLNIDSYKRKDRNFTKLLSSDLRLAGNKYYYHGHLNDSGRFEYYPLKWKRVRSGHPAYPGFHAATELPTSDFSQFKIFQIEEPPCSECAENFDSIPLIRWSETERYIDHFLMSHLEYRVSIFQSKSLKVRTLKEYVDTSATYYAGCQNKYKLHWESSEKRKLQKYYITELPAIDRYAYYSITRDMETCIFKKDSSNCGIGRIWRPTFPDFKGFFPTIEFGDYYTKDLNRAYAMIGILYKTESLHMKLSGGANHLLHPLISGSIKIELLEFQFKNILDIGKWRTPGQISIISDFNKLYVSSDLFSTWNAPSEKLRQQVCIGFEHTLIRKKIPFAAIFLQSGISWNYETVKTTTSPVIQIGILTSPRQIWKRSKE